MDEEPLSSAACKFAWRRRTMASDGGFAGTANATLCSSCVPAVIAASGIAVSPVAGTHGSASYVAPTVVTSRVAKGGSIIAIASSAIGGVRSKLQLT